jgi:Chaperone of endosialidase
MRILATGEVGIGTATPTSSLHVVGDMRTDGALRVAGQAVVGGPLTVSSSVGIGTATPTQTLEVVGTVKATAFQGNGEGLTGVRGTDSTKVAKTGDTMSGTLAITAAGTALSVASNAAVGGTLTVGSNVGIGTISPGQALDVVGQGLFRSAPWAGAVPGVAGTVIGFDPSNANGTGFLWSHTTTGVATRLWMDGNPIIFAPAGAERMRVDSGGNVGIGTTLPRYTLEVNGSAGMPGGGAWTNASDLRLKRDVQPLQGALHKLLNLRGVRYRWQEPAKHGNLTGEQMGFVAQEVEAVFPEWVSTNPDGLKDLTIRGLEALVVEAFRELNNKIEALEQQRPL